MVDITAIANETGLMLRTLLTLAAWDIFSERSQIQGRDLNIRLSRMVNTLHTALNKRKGPKENMIKFSTVLEPRGNLTNKSVLIAAVEKHACAESVITIMLPSEVAEKCIQSRGMELVKSSGIFGNFAHKSNKE
jgi:hypothetical protein